MTRAWSLIDDLGREHPWPWTTLAGAFDFAPADPAFLDFAVRKLGLSACRSRPAELHVRLAPHLLSERTHAALLYRIADEKPHILVMTWFDEDWHHEILSSRPAMLGRVGELVAAVRQRPSGPRLATATRSFEGILQPRGHVFEPLLRLWLERVWPDDMTGFFARHGLLDHSGIRERDPNSGGYVFRRTGLGAVLYGAEWRKAAIGRRVEDQPDRAHGEGVARACQAVDETDSPFYEFVHATVRHPAAGDRIWAYERLMLPWHAPDGRRILTVATAPVRQHCSFTP